MYGIILSSSEYNIVRRKWENFIKDSIKTERGF